MLFWIETQGEDLEQGDFLTKCWVPMVGADFDPTAGQPQLSVGQGELIIVTQSCDLANQKIELAALCPISPLGTWELKDPRCAKKGFWEAVRKGRVEGLHMLGAFGDGIRRCKRQPQRPGRGLPPNL